MLIVGWIGHDVEEDYFKCVSAEERSQFLLSINNVFYLFILSLELKLP